MKIKTKYFYILIIILSTFFYLYGDNNELIYHSNKINYNYQKKIITLINNCYIKYGDMELTADKVTYHTNRDILIAEGHINFESKKNSFTGESLQYNLKTKKAILNQGRIPIEKGYINGENLLSEKEKYIYGKNSTFSTCNKVDPHYSIKTKKLKVIKNDKILISPVIFYIGHVPVFYLPSYLIPIPEKRKTGFLQPTISNNSIDGITYTQPFFLIINSFSDLTYTFNYMSVRGLKHLGNLRLKTTNGFGDFNFEYLYDKIYNTKRWQIDGYLRQKITGIDVNATAKANFFSDKSYYSDFGENIYDRTKNEASSYLVFEKTIKNILYAKFKLYHYKSWEKLENDYNEKTLSNLPEFSINLYSKEIFPNLYINGNSNISNNYEDNSFKNLSFNNSFGLTFKHTLLKYFNFTESMTNNVDYYKIEDREIERWVPTFNFSSYTKIYGYFNILNIGASNKIKHTITPGINFSYTPDMPQVRFQTMGIGAIPERQTLSYSLSNNFMLKKDSGGTHSFLKINFSASQNLLKNNYSFSNISSTSLLTPYIGKNIRLNLRINTSFDPYENKLENLSSYNSFSIIRESFRINLGLNYNKNYINDSKIATLNAQTNLNLTKNWSLSHNLLYDIDTNEIRTQSFKLKRNLHCWNMNIEWENRENGVIDYKFFIGLNAFKDFKWDYNKEIQTMESEEL